LRECLTLPYAYEAFLKENIHFRQVIHN
jgi:hypothetical protein